MFSLLVISKRPHTTYNLMLLWPVSNEPSSDASEKNPFYSFRWK